MISWLGAWWTSRNLSKGLRIAQTLPDQERRWVVKQIRARVELLRDQREASEPRRFLSWLKERLAADMQNRHLSFRMGARSERDPRWLQASILEAWTLLLIYKGGSTDRAQAVDKRVIAAFPDL